MKRGQILILLLILLPVFCFAQDKPSVKEVQKVMDYYYNGSGQGVILVDYKICYGVHEEGSEKNQWKDEIADRKVGKGEKAYLWMNFFVPSGDTAKILMEFMRNNKVRAVQNATLTGSIRYRTWKTIKTDKTGNWTINLGQELDEVDLDIGKIQYTVVDKEQ